MRQTEQPAFQTPAVMPAHLAEIISAATDAVVAEIHPSLRLHEDLGVDSLEMASLLVAIESHFGVVVDADHVARLHTVRDLADAIEAGRAAMGS